MSFFAFYAITEGVSCTCEWIIPRMQPRTSVHDFCVSLRRNISIIHISGKIKEKDSQLYFKNYKSEHIL